jgi:hypothetical protein
MNTRTTALLLLWLFRAGAGTAQEAPITNLSFSITLKAPRTLVKVGTRIPLFATMTNVSDRNILMPTEGTCGLPEVLRQMHISVYGGDGHRIPYTHFGGCVYVGSMISGPPRGYPPLKPGESFMEEADLNKEFDLSKPGKYTAEAERNAEGPITKVVSNRISFTVVAEDDDAPKPKASFSLSIAITGTAFPIGSPILLSATMTNTSGHDAPIRKENNPWRGTEVPRRLIIQVFDSHYGSVPETPYGHELHVADTSAPVHGFLSASLKPGESYKEEADLSKEFDLTTPGTYIVVLLKRDPDTGEKVRSNKVTFTVTQ